MDKMFKAINKHVNPNRLWRLQVSEIIPNSHRARRTKIFIQTLVILEFVGIPITLNLPFQTNYYA